MTNINSNRPYVFSADMNLHSMYSIAVIAYAATLADGANGALEGKLIIPGESLSTFWLNSIIIGAVIVMLISFFFYLRALGRALNGVNGAKHYEPKATSLMDYLKNSIVLTILLFFTVLQTGHIYTGFQSGYKITEMVYIIHFLMCLAAVAGIVGLIQTVILHIRQIKQNTQPVSQG